MQNERAFEYSEFIGLLKKLDARLHDNNLYLHIRAIGGFAMIYWVQQYKLEYRGASRDIDSLELISVEVKKVVEQVADDEQVAYDWLNNAWINSKNYNDELEEFADWIPIEAYTFDNIDIDILDLETLLLFKLRAVDDKVRKKEIPREQDVEDIQIISRIFQDNHIKIAKSTWRRVNKYTSAIKYLEQLDHTQLLI